MIRHNSHNNNNNPGNKFAAMPPPVILKRRSNGSSSSSSGCSPMVLILVCFLSSCVSFYSGIFVGMHMDRPDSYSYSYSYSIGGTSSNTDCRKLQQENSNSELNSTSNPNSGNSGQIPDANANTNADANADASSRRASIVDFDFKSEPKPPPTPPPSKLRQGANANANADADADTAQEERSKIHHRKLEYLKRHHRQARIFLPSSEYVDRAEFVQKFDSLGVVFDETDEKYNDRVMILYSEIAAYPDASAIMDSNSSYFQRDWTEDEEREHKIRSGVVLSVEEATKNCHNMHVVLSNPDREHQCIALVGQYESFHVQKFMRASEEPDPAFRSKDKFKIDPSLPLRPVNRGMKVDGGRSIHLASDRDFETNWRNLAPYLANVEDVLDILKPVAASVAAHNLQNTVVVMVCNFGQSELLMNFVCNARARGLGKDLSNILVFSTDEETHELATFLGLTSFYNEAIFGAMPKKAAEEYGDYIFAKMMMAKVYCVHLVSMLGHDLLFQDVDVIWYKNPLEFFHDEANTAIEGYDMVFQDDGARTLFYAPYAANTGFYYVKNNPKTKLFFNSLLFSGDLILSSFSHQIALVALLSEHVSLYGLRVKIWDRNAEEFPGGFLFHDRPDLMKKLIAGDEFHPYIFHMSWTESKDNKVRFLQQMGLWYLKESCRNKSMLLPREEEEEGDSNHKNADAGGAPYCCVAKPLVKCHYRDKPSMHPCPDSPLIDPDGTSFW